MLVVLVIIGILVLIALPNLMPLISKAKAMEAQQQPLVTEEGNANYRIEIVEAGESGFKAHAISVVDFDKDGQYNTWEIDQGKKLTEIVRD